MVACCSDCAGPCCCQKRGGNAKTRVDERSTGVRTLLAPLGSVVAGIRDSCSSYAGFRPWLLYVAFHGAAAPRKRKNARRWAIYVRFCVLLGFWLRWALSWPESGIAVPATLFPCDFARYLACSRAGSWRFQNGSERQFRARVAFASVLGRVDERSPCCLLPACRKSLYWRKFRSQTSDNMERWKSRGGKSQRGEEKKMQVRRCAKR